MSKPRPHFVLVTIWEHIEPIARGDRYEDPLYDALGEEDLKIVGGGSSFTRELGIEYVNIELELTSLALIPKIIETLEQQGAPKGSDLKYTFEGKETIKEFGTTECLALFLDGVNLPKEVYQSTDIDELVERLLEACVMTLPVLPDPETILANSAAVLRDVVLPAVTEEWPRSCVRIIASALEYAAGLLDGERADRLLPWFGALAVFAHVVEQGSFRAAAKVAHPDAGGTDERFRLVNEARRVLRAGGGQ